MAVEQVLAQFRQGRYPEVITALRPRADLGARETALLGMALFRSGQLREAEPVLLRAHLLGDREATVEFGNMLRATGRLEEAVAHLDAALAHLEGELHLRALRWLGVAQFQRGQVDEGLRSCERAWHGYITLGDDNGVARLSQNLALMYKEFGDYARAEHLLGEALGLLERAGDREAILTTLQTLVELHLDRGRIDQARRALERAQPFLPDATVTRRLFFLTSEAAMCEVEGDLERYRLLLREVVAGATEVGERELLLWSVVKLAEHSSRLGDHAQAMRYIYQFPVSRNETLPVELRVVRAVVHRRLGSYRQAISELNEIVDIYKARGYALELTRAQLQLAYAYHLAGQPSETAVVLRETLESLLRMHTQSALRPELEELSDLLHFAALEPDLAPYLEPILENLAGLAGAPEPTSGQYLRLQVYTFGRVAVYRDGEEAHFTLKGSVPLLVYLALTPGRTRVEMQLDLYPDKEPEAAGNYIRQAVREVRDVLGRDVIVHEGPHHQPRYRLGPSVRLDLDVTRFMDAVSHGEVAKALAVYRGEFLPGMDESQWVLQHRDEARLALCFELRNQIARFRSEGEWRRVILLCNQYLRVDPYEREVHEVRVEAARRVASAPELARYVSQLNALDN